LIARSLAEVVLPLIIVLMRRAHEVMPFWCVVGFVVQEPENLALAAQQLMPLRNPWSEAKATMFSFD
jgi:hypothetical protein